MALPKAVDELIRASAKKYRDMLVANGGSNSTVSDFDFIQGAEWMYKTFPKIQQAQITRETVIIDNVKNIG